MDVLCSHESPTSVGDVRFRCLLVLIGVSADAHEVQERPGDVGIDALRARLTHRGLDQPDPGLALYVGRTHDNRG